MAQIWNTCSLENLKTLAFISDCPYDESIEVNELIKFLRIKWLDRKIKDITDARGTQEYLYRYACAMGEIPFSKFLMDSGFQSKPMIQRRTKTWFDIQSVLYPELEKYRDDLLHKPLELKVQEESFITAQRIVNLVPTFEGWGYLLAYDKTGGPLPIDIYNIYLKHPELFTGELVQPTIDPTMYFFQNNVLSRLNDIPEMTDIRRAYFRMCYLSNRIKHSNIPQLFRQQFLPYGINNIRQKLSVAAHTLIVPTNNYLVNFVNAPCGCLFYTASFIDDKLYKNYTSHHPDNIRAIINSQVDVEFGNNIFASKFMLLGVSIKNSYGKFSKYSTSDPIMLAGYRSRYLLDHPEQDIRSGLMIEDIRSSEGLESYPDEYSFPIVPDSIELKGRLHNMTNPPSSDLLLSDDFIRVLRDAGLQDGLPNNPLQRSREIYGLIDAGIPEIIEYFENFNHLDPLDYAWYGMLPAPVKIYEASYVCMMRGIKAEPGIKGMVGSCLAATLVDAGFVYGTLETPNPVHEDLAQVIVEIVRFQPQILEIMLRKLYELKDQALDILTLYMSDSDLKEVLVRGYLEPVNLHPDTLKRATKYVKATPYQQRLLRKVYDINNNGTLATLLYIPRAPIEKYIMDIKDDDISSLVKYLRIVFPRGLTPELQKQYIYDDIQRYNRLLDRGKIKIPPKPNLEHLNLMADAEILDRLKCIVGFESSTSLINIAFDLFNGVNHFFIPNERKCGNPLTVQNLDDTEDPSIFIIAYGHLDKYVCFTLQDIVSAMKYGSDVPDYVVSGFDDEPYEKVDESLFVELINILRGLNVTGKLSAADLTLTDELIQLKETIDIENSKLNSVDLQIVKAFRVLPSSDKDYLKIYLTKLFEVGMYMRQWRGPGFIYPYTSSESRAIGVDESGALYAQKHVDSIGFMYDKASDKIKTFLGELHNIKYDYRNNTLQVLQHKFHPRFVGVCEGKDCQRIGSGIFIVTSFHYLILLFNMAVPNFDITRLRDVA